MDLILLDWTRMGHSYCLAGAVRKDGGWQVVRPLPVHHRNAAVRNVGWSPYLMDGHARWEEFELVGAELAEPIAPHLEDVWVKSLRPRRRVAAPAVRREILRATLAAPEAPWFGAPLTPTRSAAFLAPGAGTRSLVGVLVPARSIHFRASWREGTADPDYRVSLDWAGWEARSLPVKDHFLLRSAEVASDGIEGRIRALAVAVGQMGDPIVVRLGLSRSFQATPQRAESACWLMADGFFSFNDPQS